MTYRVLSLFAGIGGFDLGLERTGGFNTVAFCEIDPNCQRVLRTHWSYQPIFKDVRDVRGHELGPIDVVCGGFPCQPFSSASRGRRNGTADDRYLWPEMLRVVSECRPAWVVAENVADLDGLALAAVVSDLESLGYAVRAFEIPACAVGHDHRRARLWILGYADRQGQPRCAQHAEVDWVSRLGYDPRDVGAAHGVPSAMDRMRMLGNAVVPQIPELLGRAILAAEAA